MKLLINHQQLQAIYGHMSEAVAAAASRGRGKLNTKSRTLIDVGILCFMLTASFNAGIEYSRINTLTQNQQKLSDRMDKVESDENQVVAKLAAVQQVLIDIRDEIKQEREDAHHGN